ncbi:MAG: hypothetical protein Ta2F_11830 [Termitinemataceae bacterium]|nr:MAG: hypothetical protein Ta2F_11830 [Termitinemataceae bacterium]
MKTNIKLSCALRYIALAAVSMCTLLTCQNEFVGKVKTTMTPPEEPKPQLPKVIWDTSEIWIGQTGRYPKKINGTIVNTGLKAFFAIMNPVVVASDAAQDKIETSPECWETIIGTSTTKPGVKLGVATSKSSSVVIDLSDVIASFDTEGSASVIFLAPAFTGADAAQFHGLAGTINVSFRYDADVGMRWFEENLADKEFAITPAVGTSDTFDNAIGTIAAYIVSDPCWASTASGDGTTLVNYLGSAPSAANLVISGISEADFPSTSGAQVYYITATTPELSDSSIATLTFKINMELGALGP